GDAVEGEALGLGVGPVRAADVRALVPVHAQPAPRVQDALDRALHQAGLVRVLDAHQELAAVVTRVQPRPDGGADVAPVRVARGTGGVADADGAFVRHLTTFEPSISSAGATPCSSRSAWMAARMSAGSGASKTRHA